VIGNDKSRIRLAFATVDDLAAAENLVGRLGATRLPDMDADCVVYADPEGHPFCLYTSP
jgi:Glyoxalase-like domain